MPLFPVDTRLSILVGMMAAIGAGLCCVAPFILVTLGISGAWISNLTLLEPYRPVFIAAVLILFGWAGWKVYQPIEKCEPDTACAVPQTRKWRQIIFWVTAFIALILITGSYWIPLVI